MLPKPGPDHAPSSLPIEQSLTQTQVWRYASVGLVTAAASLPLYLLVPHLYAQTFGASLTAVGLILMAVRLLDAWTDPWFGRLIDQTRPGRGPRFQVWIRPALVVLVIGFIALFLPPAGLLSETALLIYLAVSASLISLANGVVTVAHQAWPVRWKPAAHQLPEQVRLVSAREWLILVGVIVSSALAAGDQRMALCAVLVGAAGLSFWLIRGLPGQDSDHGSAGVAPPLGQANPMAHQMARLLTMLTVNALASAIPATLFLFFVSDYFLASRTTASVLLLTYFVSALVGIVLWQRPLARLGPSRIMTTAMVMGCLSFVWVLLLPNDGLIGFAIVCVLTGLALGAELICPALLIGQQLQAMPRTLGASQSATIFGRWQLLAKCSLAAAAGLCLPGLALLGYQPGTSEGLEGLLWVYAGLPCLLKLVAIGLQSKIPNTTSPQTREEPLR
jgi:glycoside/pentoside/hexuronide:cation symporter, GPH family